MEKFYCREEELRKLNKRYHAGDFECIIIYGRRRVGKTTLINEFCKDKPTIFFSALNTTEIENLESLSKSIMNYERPDMDAFPEFKTYDAALDELTALSMHERIVFVIDEYPYKMRNIFELFHLFLQCFSILLTINGITQKCSSFYVDHP